MWNGNARWPAWKSCSWYSKCHTNIVWNHSCPVNGELCLSSFRLHDDLRLIDWRFWNLNVPLWFGHCSHGHSSSLWQFWHKYWCQDRNDQHDNPNGLQWVSWGHKIGSKEATYPCSSIGCWVTCCSYVCREYFSCGNPCCATGSHDEQSRQKGKDNQNYSRHK